MCTFHWRFRSDMKRLVLPLASASVIGVTAAAGIWLGFSANGLATVARLAETASGGQLRLEQPSGRLAGPLSFGRIAWQAPGVDVQIERLRVDWSPSELLMAHLSISEITAARVAVDMAASDAPSEAPVSLRLPVAVDVEKIAISVLDYGSGFSATDLHATFASDGRKHRLSDLRGKVDKTEISGNMALGGDAPLPVQASATLAGTIDEQPVRLRAEASGPLASLLLKLTADEGVRGDAHVTLTPFARHVFAEAHLALAARAGRALPAAAVAVAAARQAVPRGRAFRRRHPQEQPAARVGDMTQCVGPPGSIAPPGCLTVLIGP